MSHIRASSQPPPNAWPETAAIMGFFIVVVSCDLGEGVSDWLVLGFGELWGK